MAKARNKKKKGQSFLGYELSDRDLAPVRRRQKRDEARRQSLSGRALSPGAKWFAQQEKKRGKPVTHRDKGKRLSERERQRVREREFADLYIDRRRLSPTPPKMGRLPAGVAGPQTHEARPLRRPATISNRRDLWMRNQHVDVRSPAQKLWDWFGDAATGVYELGELAATDAFDALFGDSLRVNMKGGPPARTTATIGAKQISWPTAATTPFANLVEGAQTAAEYTPEALRAFGYEIPRTYAEDVANGSFDSFESDIQFVRDTIAGAIAAPEMLTRPEEMYEAIKQDFRERYGAAFTKHPDWKRFRQAIRDNGGVSYLADVAVAAGPVGAGVSRGVGALARAGKLGRRLERVATEPRRDLRYSPGEEGVKRQLEDETQRDGGVRLHRAAFQKAIDARRARLEQRDLQRAANDDGFTPNVVTRDGEVRATPLEQMWYQHKDARFRHSAISARTRARQTEELAETRRLISELDDMEKLGLIYTLRGTIGQDAQADIERLIDLKETKRTERGVSVPRKIDELNDLRRLAKSPAEAFTPRVAAAAARIRETQDRLERLSVDLDLPRRRAELRRVDQQRTLLGVVKPKEYVDELEQEFARLAGEVGAALDRSMASQKGATLAERRYHDDPTEENLAAMNQAQALAQFHQNRFQSLQSQASFADERYQMALNPHEYEQAELDEMFGSFEERALAGRPLSEAEMVDMVDFLAEKAGLPRAAYVRSERRTGRIRDVFAAAANRTANARKTYKGENFLLGRELNDPELIIAGMARLIKVQEQWPRVMEGLRRHADMRLTGPDGARLIDIHDRIIEHNLDPDKYMFLSPGLANDFLDGGDGITIEDIIDGELPGAAGEEIDDLLGEIMEHSSFDGANLNMFGDAGSQFEQVRFFAVPKSYYNEIAPSTVQNNKDRFFLKGSRAYNIGKSTVSRAMFFLNVPWVLANIGSNLIIGGLTPVDFVRARRWYDKLSPEAKAELAPWVEVFSRLEDLQKQRMGAAGGRLTAVWEEMHKLPLVSARPLQNSVSWWMQMEQKVANQPFFLARLYKEMQRDPRFHKFEHTIRSANELMQATIEEGRLGDTHAVRLFHGTPHEVGPGELVPPDPGPLGDKLAVFATTNPQFANRMMRKPLAVDDYGEVHELKLPANAKVLDMRPTTIDGETVAFVRALADKYDDEIENLELSFGELADEAGRRKEFDEDLWLIREAADRTRRIADGIADDLDSGFLGAGAKSDNDEARRRLDGARKAIDRAEKDVEGVIEMTLGEHAPSFQRETMIELGYDAFRRVDYEAEGFPDEVGILEGDYEHVAIHSRGFEFEDETIPLNGLIDIVKLPPEQQAVALRIFRKDLEHYGARVYKALGDFQNMSSLERATVGRIMFYPWIRFSLRYTFYTLPKDHPLLVALVAKLAELRREELEQIYGTEDIPFWVLAKVSTPFGEMNLARLNPLGNAVSEWQGSADWVRSLPPGLSTALDLIFRRRMGEGGRTLEADGRASTEKEPTNLWATNAAQIALADLLQAAYVTRFAGTLDPDAVGRQTDDSIPWLNVEKRDYKRQPQIGFNERQIAADRAEQNPMSAGLRFLFGSIAPSQSSRERSKLSVERRKHRTEGKATSKAPNYSAAAAKARQGRSGGPNYSAAAAAARKRLGVK